MSGNEYDFSTSGSLKLKTNPLFKKSKKKSKKQTKEQAETHSEETAVASSSSTAADTRPEEVKDAKDVSKELDEKVELIQKKKTAAEIAYERLTEKRVTTVTTFLIELDPRTS